MYAQQCPIYYYFGCKLTVVRLGWLGYLLRLLYYYYYKKEHTQSSRHVEPIETMGAFPEAVPKAAGG